MSGYMIVGKVFQIQRLIFFLGGKKDNGMVSGEFLQKPCFSDPSPAIQNQELKPVLLIKVFKQCKLFFPARKHQNPPPQK